MRFNGCHGHPHWVRLLLLGKRWPLPIPNGTQGVQLLRDSRVCSVRPVASNEAGSRLGVTMTPWVCMGWVSIDVHAMHSNTEPHSFFEGFLWKT